MTEPSLEGTRVKASRASAEAPAPIRWYLNIFKLRIEELVALLFFFPMVFFTAKAYFFFKAQGHIPRLFIGDIQRVFGVIVVVILFQFIVRYRANWTFLRDSLPFAYCLAIYTNLHDTIHFVNPHDIQDKLIAIDQWLFGAQPSVWAERFIHPALTEVFSFCYWMFFLIAPSVALVLYLQNRKIEFRATLVSVILCFYAGYMLYLIFPAVSPNIALKNQYTLQFNGTPITDVTMRIAQSLPSDVRDAFPSLHAAVTLLSLMFAFKYVRWLFWILLPISIGLILSTIYLRHHYVIDLPAGFILGIAAFMLGPKIDVWWRSMNPSSDKAI